MPKEKWPDTTCACEECKSYCRKKPCWPIPTEARRLIEAGYGARLMLDWWEGGDRVGKEGEKIFVLCPACVGHAQDYAPSNPFWKERCVFFSKDELCELHALKLKPYEGRKAFHASFEGTPRRVHLIKKWHTPEARKLIEDWKKRFCEKDAPEASLFDVVGGLFDFLEETMRA